MNQIDVSVGDIIKIIDNGGSFSSYSEWVVYHNLKKHNCGKLPSENENYKVICIGEHLTYKNHYNELLGVECLLTGKQYIIENNDRFIKFVSKGQKQFEFEFC
jgi:hypothetical protein